MLLSVVAIFLTATTAGALSFQNVSGCSCGYYDPATGIYFTDSTIIYFNETTTLPRDDFAEEAYENKYEKGWNTRYCQGSKASNVDVEIDPTVSNTALQLSVDPSSSNHLVVGGAVQTRRRDIFYGSFRTLMRSPRSWAPGSALSMTLHFNESQTINMDLMNPDDPSQAWVGMFLRNEFPSRDKGANYSTLLNESINPWEYTEYRVDWTEKRVNFYIAGKLFRSVPKGGKNYPQTPAPLRLKHWSVGNWFTMQGPPKNRSVADVQWVRAFFNSSLITDQDRDNFALRCPLTEACSTENMALRGSSPFTEDSVTDWKQAKPTRPDRLIPKIILIISGSMSAFLLANAFLRRLPHPNRRLKELRQAKMDIFHRATYGGTVAPASDKENAFPSPSVSRPISYFADTVPPTPVGSSGFSLEDYFHSQRTSIKSFDEGTRTPRISWREFSEGLKQNDVGSAPARNGVRHGLEVSEFVLKLPQTPPAAFSRIETGPVSTDEITPVKKTTDDPPQNYERPAADIFCFDSHQTFEVSNQMTKKPRVDYLAGLLSFSCVLVTLIQFALTFSPASIDPGADAHYATEPWTRKTINSYFLNLVWVGPFLMTSARFLVSDYFETGDLLGVAQKTVRRPFRLLMPVMAIAMLEYFFMDSGAVNWLEYMASVTWSTWPFTRVPNNFGYFLSEILELAYLIPNAAPQITFNYCTGVLWTIPVQLQGSWVTLLGVVMIREIKTPWKRFCYYSFCVLMHWYALSWGTYFYLGIMLADLEINFQYRKWLYARPSAYYPLMLLLAVVTISGLTLDTVTQWTKVNYAAYEYGIHPDIPTGQPIMFTGAVGYPQYYVPKLNGIVFAVGLQTLVELSSILQNIFSLSVFLRVFPHIFTIYLIHGFVFWSLGSTVFIYLAAKNFDYWKMVTIAAVSCYAALFLGVPILTPVVSVLGKSVTANIWQFSHEVPSPRRPTLHPFPDNFLFFRQAFAQDAEPPARQVEPVVSTKLQGRFMKFVAGLVAAASPRSSSRPGHSDVSLARSGSLSKPAARKIGWRTGGLSTNVAMLKRNNSRAERPSPD